MKNRRDEKNRWMWRLAKATLRLGQKSGRSNSWTGLGRACGLRRGKSVVAVFRASKIGVSRLRCVLLAGKRQKWCCSSGCGGGWAQDEGAGGLRECAEMAKSGPGQVSSKSRGADWRRGFSVARLGMSRDASQFWYLCRLIDGDERESEAVPC